MATLKFVRYFGLLISASSMVSRKVDWQRYRATSREKLHRVNHGSNYYDGSFSDGDNVRAPIQFRRESQSQ